MKRWIHASTLLNSTKEVVDEIAKYYKLITTIPKEDYVLKGDGFMYKADSGNVYRVVLVPEDNGTYVILQCIADAYVDANGKESYDDARDIIDQVVPDNEVVETIVDWTQQNELRGPFTEYFDE